MNEQMPKPMTKTTATTTDLVGGGGGANFPTSDDLQIFFGAFYHELVCISLELKGSDDFKSGTCVLLGMVLYGQIGRGSFTSVKGFAIPIRYGLLSVSQVKNVMVVTAVKLVKEDLHE